MECNKDEAIRAKEIAERKFTERDFAVAKKFALKAQNLYPELEGLSQMLVTIEVYASAETRTSTGEVDWYCVLGVNPWADDDTIRKQYRKLALMLHPDKNKSLGADGAFKLVLEAWSLLSDKAKRLAYNEKLNVIGFQHRASTHTKVPSTQPSANGFYNSSSAVNSDARTHNKNTQTTSVPSPSYKKSDTFWTICNRCKTQYEYMRIYLNHTLLCPNCNEAFLAVEKAPPPNIMRSSNNSSRQKHQSSRNRAANNHLFNVGRNCGAAKSSGSEGFGVNSNCPDLQWNHLSRMSGGGGSVASPSTAASGVQQAHQRVKREREEEKATPEWKTSNLGLGADQLYKRRFDETYRNSEQRRATSETERVYGFSGINIKSISKRELSPLELRNMLMEKAQLDISKKLQEWISYQEKVKENRKMKSMVMNDGNDHNKRDNSAVTNERNKSRKSFPDLKSAAISINVPDSDFHNFDLDRTERSFGEDQVWAAYDDDDGMPRYYARIKKVISLRPFKMQISWLNSRSSHEFSSIDWVGSGFLKTCGDFRAGRYEVSQRLNSFSHKVRWMKGIRGLIRILPRKGDIWALYRNWSPDWDENTPNEVIHQYDMVEVLDDYNEEQGVPVAPLVKVAGFKTVFHRHMDSNEVRKIPKEEMFRFSHQVPDRLLTGEEAHNAPKGCRELDPAATSLELLQVITEANESKMVETKKAEEIALNFTESNADQNVENSLKPKEGGTLESNELSEDNK